VELAYKPGTKFFHLVDPITKFVWVLLIALWLYSLKRIEPVIAVCVSVTILSFIGAGLNVEKYVRSTLILFAGSWFVILYQGIVRNGPGLNVIGIEFSYDGLKIGLAIALRIFGLIAVGMAYSVTTSPQDLESALIKIGVPYRISRICYLALRLIPIMQRDMQAIEDVQNLRGIKKGRARFKITILALVATELRMVDDIAISLETRGFGRFPTRTEINEVKISYRGLGLLIITFGCIILQYVYL
jgi:energy-coupling factor transporter transmembrane protein EcfT